MYKNKNIMRKILVTAAFTAMYGCISTTLSSAETISITDNGTGYINGGTGVINTVTSEYFWEKGNLSSVDVSFSGKKLIIKDFSSSLKNGILQASSGDLYIENGTLTIDKGSSITSAVNTEIAPEATLAISGGTVALNDAIYDGIVSISRGTLTISDTEKLSTATFSQTGGTTTVVGNKFQLNNSSDSIDGGKLNIGNSTTGGTLTVKAGTISNNTDVTINTNSKIDVQNGTVSLDSNDTWSGDVKLSGGTLNIDNTSKWGALNQIGGTTNITGTQFALNNEYDAISGGNVNIGDGNTVSKLSVEKGVITEDATVNLNEKSTLNITGGTVTLDTNDTWNGNVKNSGGSLALVGIAKNGTFTQSSGSTTVTGQNFNLNSENDCIDGGSLTIGNGVTKSQIEVSKGGISKNTTVALKQNSELNITGGNVALDEKSTWNGSINLSDGTLELNDVEKDSLGNLAQTGGRTDIIGTTLDLNSSGDLISGGTLNIGNQTTETKLTLSQGSITSDATVNLNKNSTMAITGGDVALNSGDKWFGNIEINNGTLSLTDISKSSDGKFTQSGGTTSVVGSLDLNNNDDKITSGNFNIGDGTTSSTVTVSKGTIEKEVNVALNQNSTLDISGGSATLDNSDTWEGDVNNSGGSLALVGINNKKGVFTQTSGTTTITENGFDLNNSSDKISGGELNIGDGTTTSDMSVSKGTIGENTTITIAKDASLNVTGGTVALGSSTSWEGNVKISSGELSINSISKNEDSTFSQNGGTTTVTGTKFDMNNASDNVADGTFNIGDGATVSSVTVSKGSIQSAAITNIKSNATLNIQGGKVSLDENDNYNGTVNISSGSLALVGISKNSDAVLSQTGGTINISGNNFDLNNSNDKISAGTLNIGTDLENSSLTVSKGEITKDAQTNIANSSSLNITGGNVTINEDDTWDGNINISNGNLYLNQSEKNPSGVLTQTGGNTTIIGTNKLNNEADTISGGNLIIGTSDNNGELIVENGTIEKAASVTVEKNSTLNIKGGTTTLDGINDEWNGNIKINDGTLNLSNGLNKTTTTDTTFNQTGGEVNIDNSKLVLNTTDSIINSGTVNLTSNAGLTINNSSENTSEINSTESTFTIKNGSQYTTTGGTIDEDSKVTIEKDATLEINGSNADVTLDGNNDKANGHLILNKGTLNLTNGITKETTSSGNFIQTDGTLNLTNGNLTLNEDNSKITGGEVNVSEKAKLIINNGKENYSKLNIENSEFTIKNGSQYTTTDGVINSTAAVTIESGSKLKLDGADTEVTLNGTNDKIDGHLELNKGNLYISEDLTKVTDENGHYIQTGGALTMNKSSLTLAENNSKISGGDINLTNGSNLTAKQDTTNTITGGNITIDDTSVLNYLSAKGLIQYNENGNPININTSGLINMINNVHTNNSINNLTINNSTGNGQADFNIDIKARSNSDFSSDTITANSIKVATSGEKGTINIADYNLGGDILGYDAPIDKSIRLGKIFKTDNLDSEVNFTANDKEVFTPIGYYKLNASSSNDGSYTFDLTRFNPQVYRGQVATAASYLNQLAINDTIFDRAQIRHFGSSYGEAFKNKTALLDGSASVERTLKDGQLWTEVFGNFESFRLKNGIGKVRNNAWGFIVGGDFGLKELQNGWKIMPSMYIAYNGGHQSYKGVGMTENGGQLGITGSIMKDNFIETLLLNGGIYGTSIDVSGNSEDTFNYFIGLASKTAYDLKMGSHFKLQPSLTLSYNLFGEQNWHSNYGQMGMNAGMLNGFNVAPGVNFIIEQESWSIYATIAYNWNFFGSLDGRAGNVDLASVKMSNGYLQYGFGLTKTFSDRLNLYAQATIRNIGRTGILCQGGLNWRL